MPQSSPPPPPPPPPPAGNARALPTRREVPAHKTPWRDNLEAGAMAILLALFLKAFLVEAYKIPSGSMQPTLMGMPTPGDVVVRRGSTPPPEVKDRILVDKLTPKLFDPERWQVLVFRYPLKRTQNFVKRLVGMPGEELRIVSGDIFVREAPSDPWTIPRRPSRVQESHWREVTSPVAGAPWRQIQGNGWLVEDTTIVASGDGVIRFGDGSPVLDLYFDGYPDAVREALPARHPNKERLNRVGDLRLSGRLRPKAGCEQVEFVLTEGERRYRFRLPGPAAEGSARAAIEVTPSSATVDQRGVVASDETGPLAAGREVRFEAENLDDRLTLRLDGVELLTVDVKPAADQSATVSIAVTGGELALDDLTLERDIYYFADRRNEFEIPDGEYLMLGDNTLNSSDGREWRAARYALEGHTPRVLTGNLRLGENPSRSVRDSAGREYLRFTDEWGSDHLLRVDGAGADDPAPWLEAATQLDSEPAPFVPRDLIVGRALAVFWPIAPHKGIVRFEWID